MDRAPDQHPSEDVDEKRGRLRPREQDADGAVLGGGIAIGEAFLMRSGWEPSGFDLRRRSRVLLTRHRMEGRGETRTGRLHRLLLPLGDPRPGRSIKSKLTGLAADGSDPCRPMAMRYSAEVLSQTDEG